MIYYNRVGPTNSKLVDNNTIQYRSHTELHSAWLVAGPAKRLRIHEAGSLPSIEVISKTQLLYVRGSEYGVDVRAAMIRLQRGKVTQVEVEAGEVDSTKLVEEVRNLLVPVRQVEMTSDVANYIRCWLWHWFRYSGQKAGGSKDHKAVENVCMLCPSGLGELEGRDVGIMLEWIVRFIRRDGLCRCKTMQDRQCELYSMYFADRKFCKWILWQCPSQ